MPLSTPVTRKFLTGRTITCEGYLREDGLIDVEGHLVDVHLVDVRGYDMDNEWRGSLKAGDAAHDMWVRLTVDDELIIKGAQSSTDRSPYPTCREVAPHTLRLVGLRIIGGFKKAMHERIGNTEGCTHIVALIETLASVAIQALMGKRQGGSAQEVLSTFRARDPTRPALIGTCHSYAPDSPITARLWPMYYRPRE